MEVLEGKISALAALNARSRRFQVLMLSASLHEEKAAEVITAAEAASCPIKRVASDELNALAKGRTHGGVILLAQPRARQTTAQLVDQLSRLSVPPLLLLLEGVDDARNLGFTIRTAEAMGAHAVLIKKHLWDFDEGEISRPASGAFERMPLVQFDTVEALKPIQRLGVRLLGCLAGVKRSVFNANLVDPVCLCVGGEKRGLSGALREICNRFVTIPGIGGASSLPLAHAGAIVMAEARRQRLANIASIESATNEPQTEDPLPDPNLDPTSADETEIVDEAGTTQEEPS